MKGLEYTAGNVMAFEVNFPNWKQGRNLEGASEFILLKMGTIRLWRKQAAATEGIMDSRLD